MTAVSPPVRALSALGTLALMLTAVLVPVGNAGQAAAAVECWIGGAVLGWGANSAGQLGDDFTSESSSSPTGARELGPGSGTIAVAAGSAHSVALKADGSVWAWGANFSGQLGTGSTAFASGVPVPVRGLGTGSGVKAIAAGGRHSLALKADGSVWAWGANGSGQLGIGSTRARVDEPAAVVGLGAGPGAVAIATGAAHSLALMEDGSVWAWGSNGSGQLGRVTPADGDLPAGGFPRPVDGLGPGSAVSAIAAGDRHSLAVRADGSVMAWGASESGQLGNAGLTPNSTVTFRSAPSQTAVGTDFSERLAVDVTDSLGRPAPGVDVTFTIPPIAANKAGASFGGARTAVATTSATGVATSPLLQANDRAGSYTVVASTGLDAAATFVLTNVAGPASHIEVSDQVVSAEALASFVADLEAAVTDANGNPVPAAPVTFTAPPLGGPGGPVASATFAGGMSTATVLTDSGGVATAPKLTAGVTTGDFNLSVTAAGPAAPVSIPLVVTPAVAAGITINPGSTGLTQRVATQFPALQAKVTDAGGEGISGVTVTFTAPGSGASGTFAPSSRTTATATTDSTGVATAPAFTANTSLGAFVVEARTSGVASTARFELTNTTVYGIHTEAGSGQIVATGAALPVQFEAVLRDEYGNRYAGDPVPVQFTVLPRPDNGAGGSFSGLPSVTVLTQDGVARAPTFTANTKPDTPPPLATYAVEATPVTGAASGKAIFTVANALAPPLFQIADSAAGRIRSAATGTAFARPVEVSVTNPAGDPAPGVPVTFESTPTGAGGTFGTLGKAITVLTDAGGLARPPFVANAGTGTYSVVARARDTAGEMSLALPLTNTSAAPALVPVPASGLGPGSGVVAVAGGGAHSLALTAGGGVRAWGSNRAGQLGDDSARAAEAASVPIDTSVPVPVPAEPMAQIATGSEHSLARSPVGTLVAWGAGTNGQLGNASLLDSTVPVPVRDVGPIPPAVAMAAGGHHSLVVEGAVSSTPCPTTTTSTTPGPTATSSLVPTTGPPRPAPVTGGYRLAAADGGIFAFGDTAFLGSAGALRLRSPVVGMASTPSGDGYWLVAADGGVFAFGDARFLGSTGSLRLAHPVVGMASTPSGDGYWLVAADGGIFAFGDARFLGSTGALRLRSPVVGMASTPSGNGYWLVAADGGIFAFGDARFRGSTGALRLAHPVVGMASTPSGDGYRLVGADGGVFAFGDARFLGSTGALRLAHPVVGMASTPSGSGYRLVAADGGIFAFGDARFLGSTGALRLNSPVVAVAGR